MENFELDAKVFLQKYKNTTVDFCHLKGNYGDSLIWHGTLKVFKDLNITVNDVDSRSPISNEVLIVNGSGGLIDKYQWIREILQAKHNQYREVVVLPSSCAGNLQKELFRSFKSNVTFFARSFKSYDYAKEYCGNCQVLLWHDMAFYNELPLLEGGSGVLNAFRTDGEKYYLKAKKDNMDVSTFGSEREPLANFINLIGKYKVINTDRLHIAIGSAMLGKEVNMYPNSYHKNRAIFEYSLNKRFPLVKFIQPALYEVDNLLYRTVRRAERSARYHLGIQQRPY